MKKIFSTILILSLLFSGSAFAQEIKLITDGYEEIDEALFNPDRGWYKQYGGRYQTIHNGTIQDYRPHYSLSRVYFSLFNYLDKPLDKKKLDEIENALLTLKNFETNVIPRFYYFWGRPDKTGFKELTKNSSINYTGKIWISPDENIIKKHVQQISEILNNYKSTISFVEAGFLGSWGEWHSDQYGNKKKFKKFRKILINELLKNTDKEIFIALRYPTDLKRMKKLDGFERLGLHHDCPNYKSDSYPRNRAYKYTKSSPQGGEVCKLKSKSNYGCKKMKKYFKKFNFDTLNGSNWSGSKARFIDEGCFEEITNKLGYRFVLRGSKYIDGYLYFAIENVGYGKSFKDRYVKLKVDSKIIDTTINVKNWKSGSLINEKIFVGDLLEKQGELIIEDNIKLANKNGNTIYFHN